jgi:O-antigen ligase
MILGGSLIAAMLVHPVLGLGFLLGAGALLYRPFEPFWTAVLTAGLATLINNEGGHLTRELAVLTLIASVALAGAAMDARAGRWKLPRTPLLIPLLLWLATSTLAAAHGVLAGSSLRYIGLEYMPVLLTVGIALIVGGLDITDRQLAGALRFLVAVTLVHVALGIYSYHVNHVRTGGTWYAPAPGMMALLGICLAATARTWRSRLGWAVFVAACLVHQLISFSRGYWIGLAAAGILIVARFVGRGSGSGVRAGRVVQIASVSAALAVIAILGLGALYGWSNVLELFFTRLTSSAGTKWSGESASNFARLLEYGAVVKYIRLEPLFGYGLGMEFHVRYPIWQVVSHQWYMHQAYLFVLLKQGFLGLGALLLLLLQAVRLGSSTLSDRTRSDWAWILAGSAITVYVAVVDLTSFHLHQVNAPTLMALMWGVVISRTRAGRLRLVWRRTATVGESAPLTVATGPLASA